MHRAEVQPSGTKLYGGLIDHPQHGRIQVIGYSNEVQNTYGGPNCMIIHIPSADRMTQDNFVKPKETSGVLGAMSLAVFPPPPPRLISRSSRMLIGSVARGPVVQHFDLGEYEVLLADEPEAIPEALERVSFDKRPVINEEIFSWYRENAPGWHIALFCFNADRISARPVFYWFRPLEGHEDIIRLPAIDSHDGTPPRLSEPVYVNHEIFVSWPGIDGIEMDYSSLMSDETRVFMPQRVAGARLSGYLQNGDFGVPIGTLANRGQVSAQSVRRLSLPGSRIRMN